MGTGSSFSIGSLTGMGVLDFDMNIGVITVPSAPLYLSNVTLVNLCSVLSLFPHNLSQWVSNHVGMITLW